MDDYGLTDNFIDNLTNFIPVLIYFGNFFKEKGSWSIKFEWGWENTIGTDFPGGGTPILYHGFVTTAEDLGNFTYGMIGYEYGLPLSILIAGSVSNADKLYIKGNLEEEISDWGIITQGYEYMQSIGGLT